ncbi:ankyrin repeat domain-containing protein 26 [Brachionichthys hirsutus]|uniref:ankyrin repeat domain-containing protein 26 n=1 Tax=Brachionichthys hirsutus TaxID=412623 RepID=UPI003604A21C
MKKIFSFAKRKKHSSATPDSGSARSFTYDLKDKGLGKVHKAAAAGDVAKLKQLAKKNDLNQLDKENRTALHIACAGGHAEAVQFLVESKTKLNLCDNQNRSALMKAVQCQHERCVRILLENHADPNLVDINENTALHFAANIPSVSTAALLLEHEAKIDAQNKEAFTPMTVAVREDHIEMAEFLLKEGADVNFMDQDQRALLMMAAGNGQISMLRLLLRFDADITLKDNKGLSADDYAVMNEHHPCSLLIIEHSTQRNNGQPLLHQGLSTKKESALLGHLSQNVETGLGLGGPAVDKEDNGANEAGTGITLLSKSASEWSSTEDDESDLSNKKPQKVNLRKMIELKRGEASALCDKSLSGTESEPEKAEEEEEVGEEEQEGDDEEEEEEEVEEEDDEEIESEAASSSCVASFQANAALFVETASVIDDAQDIPCRDASHIETNPGHADARSQEKDPRTEAPEGDHPVGKGYAMSATFDIQDDCVVSAVRVESRFSDEDDGLGKDYLLSSAQNIFDIETSPAEGKEDEFEREMGKNNDESDVAENNQLGGFDRDTVLAKQRNALQGFVRDEKDSSDAEDDVESNKDVFKEKRRSSWGSSLDDSDDELCKEEEIKRQSVDEKGDVTTSDLQSQAAALQSESHQPNEDHQDTMWDFSSPRCVSTQANIDEPMSSSGLYSTSTQSKNRPVMADSSESGSSSENKDQNDIDIFTEMVPLVSKTNIVTANHPGMKRFSEDKGEEDEDSIERGPDDPSAAVSPLPNDKSLIRILSLDSDVVIEGELDSDNENDDDDGSWDDESDESGKPKTTEGNLLKTSAPTKSVSAKSKVEETKINDETEDGVKVSQCIIDGNASPEKSRPEENKLIAVVKVDPGKDNDASEDSDSMDEKVRFDLASTTVKVPDVGHTTPNRHLCGRNDNDECEAKLTTYVSLGSRNGTQTIDNEETISFPTKDNVAAGQCPDSDGVLPQTDIDEFDLDSSDEADSIGMTNKVPRNTGKTVIQTKDSIGDEDIKEEMKDDEEEGDMSEESDQPKERGVPIDTTSPAHETGVSKEKKRDFLSELGLEKGEEETDSWDSESCNKNPKMSHKEKQSLCTQESKDDLMEDLGLSNVDDLEDSSVDILDASDWDSASTTSKRTLLGQRMSFPGLEEFPECSNLSKKVRDEDDVVAPPTTPQRSNNSNKRLLSPPRQPVPRARKMVLQKPESEDESDWEPDNLTSSSTIDKFELQRTAELQAVVKPGSSEPSPMTKDSQNQVESDQQQQKWEKREKLWVQMENSEVRSTSRNVAGELKETFGELLKSRSTAEHLREEQQAVVEATSAEEESTDEEEGEVIIHPTARARSTVLLAIAEQRESGPEDSVPESSDKSASWDRSVCREPEADAFLNNEIRPWPIQNLHHDIMWKKDGAAKNPLRTDEDLQEKSASVSHGVSIEELDEDMERYKLEVCKEMAMSAVEVQKSSASLDAAGKALEDVTDEKPDTSLGFQSNQDGAVQEEKLPLATKSNAGASVHLFLEQSNSGKQERQTQLELVRGVRRSTAPPTKPRVNGDPLSVFHDSSLSDLSDSEGRLISEVLHRTNPEQMETTEDFDEITQSSDTATEDMDSPTSGYRHASLLVQKLDSVTLDSRSMVKLQNIFHEYERSIQKARSRHGDLSDKVVHLEMERAAIKRSLEEVKDLKSGLEHDQLELQTEVTNLKFQLKQEQENRNKSSIMYSTTRDKLRRMEEQHQWEVQEKQKVELTLRNLELEMGALVNNMKQLEEAHSETQRLLDQEHSARTLQENLLSSHLRKQQEIEEENKRNVSKSNEVLSQLTEVSDRERELFQQNARLHEQVSILKADLERSQANSSLRESHLWEEKEALKEQLEDARRDLKLNGEALTQTGFICNNQVSTLKSELAIATNRLENERQTRETLETEVESTRTRLAGAVKEAELCLAARRDTESALLREKEEHQRLKDRLTGEAASQREAISSLSQKLCNAEARANSMENEVHRVTLQLTEKGLLLDLLQREKDQTTARVKELELAQQADREVVSRAGARQEATQERLAQAQSEAMLLRQQLEEAQNRGSAMDRALTDGQERFSDIFTKLHSDCQERVQLKEERNKELLSKAAELQDQTYKLEEENNERKVRWLQRVQQELADALKKLSMSEASLEVNTHYRSDLEEEKARLLKDLDRLKGKLDEKKDQFVQAEKRISGLKNTLDDKEKELTGATQKILMALNASAASDATIKQLEEAVQRLEIENARLEAAAKQQSHKIDALQKTAQEAAMVRGHLEDVVANLQSSKMTLEDQLSREMQKQSSLPHTAQDSQALWEEELKSRSKLGLRLAELEKEKGELSTQVEIEKKKAKKVIEQRKAVDTRLDEEMKRNTELQKEIYRMRTLLKTAKKKLRVQDLGGNEFGSPVSSLRMDLGRTGRSEGRMDHKVEDLQRQLDKEASRRCQLEKANGDLKDQLASFRSHGQNNDELERSKRQLEEEVQDLRRRLEACHMEQSQLEVYRTNVEERARQDVQQKLDQVNFFLQSQAASQEALDHMRENNEAALRAQLQQKIREIEAEVDRARTRQLDNLNQRESSRLELEQYQRLYREELRLRKSLDAKLERTNCRLAEANSKLLNDRSRSLLTSKTSSLRGPSLDVGSLGSSSHYGASLGPLNRSLGLEISLSSPVPERQSGGAEDYLAKMQRELAKSITQELNHAKVELDSASARLSPVGSASWVDLDPRGTPEDLRTLKDDKPEGRLEK